MEGVVAGAEQRHVVALVAVDEVVAVAADQQVGAVAAEDRVVARPPSRVRLIRAARLPVALIVSSPPLALSDEVLGGADVDREGRRIDPVEPDARAVGGDGEDFGAVAAVDLGRIDAVAALEQVGIVAGVPDHAVVAGLAEHLVVAIAAGQHVVAVAAEQQIAAATADDGVVAALAAEGEHADAGRNRRCIERVVAEPGEDSTLSPASIVLIVAATRGRSPQARRQNRPERWCLTCPEPCRLTVSLAPSPRAADRPARLTLTAATSVSVGR